MLKTKFLYLYLSILFAFIGIFFPSHASGAIGFDIGDFFNWIIGLYLYIPRNPIEEIRFYYNLNFFGIVLLICILGLIGTMIYDIRRVKREKELKSRYIVILAISILIINSFYLSNDYITLMLFGVSFEFSSIFALIGIYQVNEY